MDFVTVTNNLSGFIEFDVTGDVKDFLSNGSNFGWLVKKTDEYQSGMVIFASRENGSINGPELLLETAALETEEVSVIFDAAVGQAVNDALVFNNVDSNGSNEQVTEPMATSPPSAPDTLTSPSDSEASTITGRMSNSTIIESSLSEQVNSTVAIPEPIIIQSNSTATTEPISLPQPVTPKESASNSTAVEADVSRSAVITENNYPSEQTNSTSGVAESNIVTSNSTLSDAATVEPFSNSTIAAPEDSVQPLNSTAIMDPIVLPESTSFTMEVSSNNTLSSDPPEQTEVKSLLLPAADLMITQDNDFDWVIAGELYVYTIIINNSGPSEATNVVVTDILPGGTRFTMFSASQ
ncbi:MAG: hypothetical protein ACREBU_25235, partial [Nitrososphaera sp.]